MHIAHIVVTPQAPRGICNHLLENPRLLDYPLTLEIRSHVSFIPNPLAMSIVQIIPRMANLVSLRISDPYPFDQKEEFISAFRNCLQQSSFQQLSLSFLYHLPFSVLDNAKNIKQLTLDYCTPDEDEPISSSPSQVSLETLILSRDVSRGLHLWAMRWVTRLTTLELRNPLLDLDWSAFPELLVACSNSLTSLYLDMGNYSTTYYQLPFTLSALTRLERISISYRSECALPEIIRVVNTAPAISDVILRLCSTTSLARVDWSLLDHLQSNFTGKRPHIYLCVIYRKTKPESILDALAANEALMDLVKRGLVILQSKHSISHDSSESDMGHLT